LEILFHELLAVFFVSYLASRIHSLPSCCTQIDGISLQFVLAFHQTDTASPVKLNGKSSIALIETASGKFIPMDYLNRGSSEKVMRLHLFVTTKKVKLADGSIITNK